MAYSQAPPWIVFGSDVHVVVKPGDPSPGEGIGGVGEGGVGDGPSSLLQLLGSHSPQMVGNSSPHTEINKRGIKFS